jgi:hypothetical protein
MNNLGLEKRSVLRPPLRESQRRATTIVTSLGPESSHRLEGQKEGRGGTCRRGKPQR